MGAALVSGSSRRIGSRSIEGAGMGLKCSHMDFGLGDVGRRVWSEVGIGQTSQDLGSEIQADFPEPSG